MSFILKVEDLSKTFILHQFNKKNIEGCRQVSFSVRKGEFVGITGKSGAGKSTVLKCIYRTYIPSGGRILYKSNQYGEIDLSKSSEQEIISLRRQEIGYISQFLKILPQVTALDVVTESLVEMGCEREYANHEAAIMLKHFELPKNLWDAYPHTFSGGEKLRLNLAQAMIKRSKLLLLDEPTAALDEKSKAPVREMILELKRAGTTMVGIFHDVAFMHDVVDCHYHMSEGFLKEAIVA